MPTMIDLFCGRGGWTNGFLLHGWRCIGYDLNPQPEYRGEFRQANVLDLTANNLKEGNYICVSSPCEEFSLHGMRNFHPNPKLPRLGILLFRHSQLICLASGRSFIMENVRSAQKFIGHAVNHCGPFYFWGPGVPAILPPEAYQVKKGISWTKEFTRTIGSSKSKLRKKLSAEWATIPLVIAEAVALAQKK